MRGKMLRKLTAFFLLAFVGSGTVLAQTPIRFDDKSSTQVTFHGATMDADEADRMVIANLKAQGSDVSHPTDVIFYFVMPSKTSANTAVKEISVLGFNCKTEKHEKLWVIAANKTMVPAEDAIISTSRLFTAIAEKHSGAYDGWEAALVLEPQN